METSFRYVDSLPDLITAEDDTAGAKIFKFHISVSDGEITILGDSPYSRELTEMLAALATGSIDMVLCG